MCGCSSRLSGAGSRRRAQSGRPSRFPTMYRRILVPLEHSDYDDAIVAHVRELATLCGSSVVLIHVADGWAARNQHQLALRESAEMKYDREYLEERADA